MIWFYVVPLILAIMCTIFLVRDEAVTERNYVLVKDVFLFAVWTLTPILNIVYVVMCVYVVVKQNKQLKRLLNKRVL